MNKLPPHIVWPGAVVALLCLSLTMGAITVVAALRDPSFLVEVDYYEKGLRWDEHAAQLQHNEELGWVASVEVGDADALHRRPLIIELHDRDGVAIEGAVIEATYFHHAAAVRVQTLTLTEGPTPGRYEAVADITREGTWEVSLEISAQGERFTDRRTLDLRWR